MKQTILFGVLFSVLLACADRGDHSSVKESAKEVPLSYQLRMTLEHDPDAFTQGLVYYQDRLIESTGGDNSWIAEYEVETATYETRVELSPSYFGEGITVLNGKLYQLTWKNKVGFVYDVNTFEKVREFAYDFEGWGITHDGRHLILSDGTEKLHYYDTATLAEVYTKSIRHNNRKASKLNELEFIDGFIYANQWESDTILKIDTATSEVVNTYDLGSMTRENKRKNPEAGVLNGIAYNPQTKDVFITGKRWPHLYVIRFKE